MQEPIVPQSSPIATPSGTPLGSPPSGTQNQYLINNVQQLFSLNQNLVNFKALFSVTSLSQEPFQGIVIDQQTLDSGETPEFKSADKGVFSGDITQDNNVASNWYLVLKSPKPNKVIVNIQSFPIPGKSQLELTQQPPVQNVQHMIAHDSASSGGGWGIPSYKENRQLYLILGGVIGVGLLYVGYKYYYLPRMLKKSNSKSSSKKEDFADYGDGDLNGDGHDNFDAAPMDNKSPSSRELQKSVESLIAQPLKAVENLQPVPKAVTDELGGDVLQQIEKQLDSIKLPPV